MSNIWVKRTAWGVAIGVGLAGLVWFAWPQALLVDTAVVTKAPMEVTVDDDGKTEVRHV